MNTTHLLTFLILFFFKPVLGFSMNCTSFDGKWEGSCNGNPANFEIEMDSCDEIKLGRNYKIGGVTSHSDNMGNSSESHIDTVHWDKSNSSINVHFLGIQHYFETKIHYTVSTTGQLSRDNRDLVYILNSEIKEYRNGELHSTQNDQTTCKATLIDP